jgi:uncharacterized delta-60 repeat protein
MKKINFTFLLLAFSGGLIAQVMDSTFGTTQPPLPQIFTYGTSLCSFPENSNDQAFAALHLSDGRIILAGYTRGPAGNDFALVRLMPNGQFDQSMGPDGQFKIDLGLPNDSCLAAVLYNEDKIVMGGCLAPPGTQDYVNLLVKTDIDGKVDSTFGTYGKVLIDLPTKQEMITKIRVLEDGKLLIAGNAFNGDEIVYFSDTSWAFVGRLMPDGQVDSTFGMNGFIYQRWEADCNISILGDIAVDNTGAIVITGASYDYYIDMYDYDDFCSHNIMVYRFGSDGRPDSTFGINSRVRLATGNGKGNALLIYPDRRILVAGASGLPSNEPIFTYVARLMPNGSLDATFSNDGFLHTATLFINLGDAAPGNPIGVIQLSGRIIVGVLISIVPDHSGFGALALTEEGKIDSTFGNNGKFVVQPGNGPRSYINQISSKSNDNFFLSGYFRATEPTNTMVIAKIKVPTTNLTNNQPGVLPIALYPNPVVKGNTLTIDLSGTPQGRSNNMLLSVFDTYGRLVYQQTNKNDVDMVNLDTSNLVSGVYIAILEQDGIRWQGRFIVQ